MLDFSNLNYFAIFITTLLTFGIGAVWYTGLFGKMWQKETGLTDKQISEGNMVQTYGGSFVCFLLLNIFLAAVFKGLVPKNWIQGAITGFEIGLFVNLASMTINYLYQYKSLKLWLIDGGYQLVIMTVAGVVLSV
jgi:hypothetical protein